jgi:hypothetical protein
MDCVNHQTPKLIRPNGPGSIFLTTTPRPSPSSGEGCVRSSTRPRAPFTKSNLRLAWGHLGRRPASSPALAKVLENHKACVLNVIDTNTYSTNVTIVNRGRRDRGPNYFHRLQWRTSAKTGHCSPTSVTVLNNSGWDKRCLGTVSASGGNLASPEVGLDLGRKLRLARAPSRPTALAVAY